MIALMTMASPVGPLRIYASADGIRGLLWQRSDEAQLKLAEEPQLHPTHALLQRASRQVRDYFAGTLQSFDLPLDPQGTPFQLAAWGALSDIPFGETRSYGEQARSLGRPKASRAIGGANNRNPISLIVP